MLSIKLCFFTSHPVADILRESSIFRALEFDNGKRHRTHGGPFDRGSADAYYGRGYEPHKMEAFLGKMKPHDLESENEKADYEAGYYHTYDRRHWNVQRRDYIREKFGYYVEYCIRPIWTLRRNEDEEEDRFWFQDSDSDSHTDYGDFGF